MKRLPPILAVLLVASLVAGPLPAQAYAPTLERTVLVLLRTLAYDRALPARVSGELRIGVVHAGDATSRQEAADVTQILAGLEGTTVNGRPLGRPALVDATDRVALGLEPAFGALVLCRGLSADMLQAVGQATRARDLSTLALDADYVGAGAALGAEQRGARLEVVLDVAAAREEGADFSSELLDLARIVGAE